MALQQYNVGNKKYILRNKFLILNNSIHYYLKKYNIFWLMDHVTMTITELAWLSRYQRSVSGHYA